MIGVVSTWPDACTGYATLGDFGCTGVLEGIWSLARDVSNSITAKHCIRYALPACRIACYAACGGPAHSYARAVSFRVVLHLAWVNFLYNSCWRCQCSKCFKQSSLAANARHFDRTAVTAVTHWKCPQRQVMVVTNAMTNSKVCDSAYM
jgi:hypothetical protein